MGVIDAIVFAYTGFIETWRAAVTPFAEGLGIEPFVLQFFSGMLLTLLIPVMASQIPRFQDDIRESLSVSGLVAIFTFFTVFYQNFHGVTVTTVWGELVSQFAGSVVTLLAFTTLYIVLEVDFKKWELVDKFTGG